MFPDQVFLPTYDVKVSVGDPAYMESDWQVSDSITISNPAPIAAPLKSVIDVIPDFSFYFPVISKSIYAPDPIQVQYNDSAPPGISVPVKCPSETEDLKVPAKGTLVCTYETDLSSGLTRTNTAIVKLKNRAGGVFSGTTVFSGTAQIDFADAVVVDLLDEEVTVTDDNKSEKYPDGELGIVNICDLTDCGEGLPDPPFENELLPDPPFEDELFEYELDEQSFSIAECSSINLDERRWHNENTATFITNDTGSTGNSSTIVKLSCIVSSSIGFEDLPLKDVETCNANPFNCNDWDYNDALVEVRFNPLPTFIGEDLKSITFDFEQPVNDSAKTHEFHIQPNVFKCADEIEDGATYSLTRNGVPIATDKPYTNDKDLEIFDDTGSPTNTAKLVIDFIIRSPGECPLDLSGYNPFGTFNGEGLFYEPSLVVKHPPEAPRESWCTIKPISDPNNPETRIVGVPNIWKWPNEHQCIWKVYPSLKPATDPEGPPNFTVGWWIMRDDTDEQCAPWG